MECGYNESMAVVDIKRDGATWMDEVRRDMLGAVSTRFVWVVVIAVLLSVACEREQPVVEETQQPEATATMPVPTATTAAVEQPTAIPEPTATAAPVATPMPETIPNVVPPAEDPPVRDLFALGAAIRAGGDGRRVSHAHAAA